MSSRILKLPALLPSLTCVVECDVQDFSVASKNRKHCSVVCDSTCIVAIAWICRLKHCPDNSIVPLEYGEGMAACIFHGQRSLPFVDIILVCPPSCRSANNNQSSIRCGGISAVRISAFCSFCCGAPVVRRTGLHA